MAELSQIVKKFLPGDQGDQGNQGSSKARIGSSLDAPENTHENAREKKSFNESPVLQVPRPKTPTPILTTQYSRSRNNDRIMRKKSIYGDYLVFINIWAEFQEIFERRMQLGKVETFSPTLVSRSTVSKDSTLRESNASATPNFSSPTSISKSLDPIKIDPIPVEMKATLDNASVSSPIPNTNINLLSDSKPVTASIPVIAKKNRDTIPEIFFNFYFALANQHAFRLIFKFRDSGQQFKEYLHLLLDCMKRFCGKYISPEVHEAAYKEDLEDLANQYKNLKITAEDNKNIQEILMYCLYEFMGSQFDHKIEGSFRKVYKELITQVKNHIDLNQEQNTVSHGTPRFNKHRTKSSSHQDLTLNLSKVDQGKAVYAKESWPLDNKGKNEKGQTTAKDKGRCIIS